MFTTFYGNTNNFSLEPKHKMFMIKTMKGYLEWLRTNFRGYFFLEENMI